MLGGSEGCKVSLRVITLVDGELIFKMYFMS
jgi:hypothetical protein